MTVLWLIGGVALAGALFFIGVAVGSWLNECGHAMSGDLPEEVFRQFRAEPVTSVRTLVDSEKKERRWEDDWPFVGAGRD